MNWKHLPLECCVWREEAIAAFTASALYVRVYVCLLSLNKYKTQRFPHYNLPINTEHVLLQTHAHTAHRYAIDS